MPSSLEILPNGSDGTAAGIDFVFVHGLNPLSHQDHSSRTWTHKDGTMWPRDLLPGNIPKARIMLFTYNANVAWDASEAGIRQHANDLLDLLNNERTKNLCTRPIIFVCHSLGGLVVKQALLTANLNRQFTSLRERTSAIAFFGTPHRGGNGATLGQCAVNLVRAFSGSSRNDLVKSLQKNSLFLAHLTADFKHICEDFNYLSVRETRSVLNAPVRMIVVDKESAELGLPGHREHVIDLDFDHRQICKFTDNELFKRILRHILRLVTLAKEEPPVSQNQSSDLSEQSNVRDDERERKLENFSAESPPRLSTLDFTDSKRILPRKDIERDLMNWLDSDSNCLILHGDCGSGKTSAIFEFVRSQQQYYSTFWFEAEDTESLQNWYHRASLRIAHSRPKANNFRTVSRWLLDPANGKWLLVFDDANSKINYKNMIPNVPWCKVIFTSRDENLTFRAHQSHISHRSMEILPFPFAQASELFRNSNSDRVLTSSQHPTVHNVISYLKSNPLAVHLAGIHFQKFQTLADLEPVNNIDSLINSERMDLIERWTSLLIEDSRESQRMLLAFLVLFGRRNVQQHIITACQKYIRRLRDMSKTTEFLRANNTKLSIQYWISIGLLSRQMGPDGPLFVIPSFVQSVVFKQLSKDLQLAQILLDAGLSLVAMTASECKPVSTENISSNFQKTVDSFRGLCISAQKMSMQLPDGLQRYLKLAAMHYLENTIREGENFYTKASWRQWLSWNQYPPPAYESNTDDKFSASVPIVHSTDWVETLLSNDDYHTDGDSEDWKSIPKALIRNPIVPKLWKELHLALLLCGMGNAWHGIRDYIFDYARENFHPDFSESQKSSFIDFIDKGGAEGLQSLLQATVLRGQFPSQATAMIKDSDTIHYIVDLVYAISGPYTTSLPREAIETAVSSGLDGLMHDVFREAVVVMKDALVPLQDLINNMLQGALDVPSNGEGARTLVSFAISSMGEPEIKKRCLAIAEAYCDFLDNIKIWLAVKVSLQLAYAVMNEKGTTEEAYWDNICAIIELAREGIMPLEKIAGESAEVAGRRMLYWCAEAHKFTSAWGALKDSPQYDFRNQSRWEEACILMGDGDCNWILS